MFRSLVVILLLSFLSFGSTESLSSFSDFTPISLESLNEEQRVIVQSSWDYSYPGVGYKYFLRDLNTAYPEKFNYRLSYSSSFVIAKNKFELVQQMKYSRDEFHFLSPKTMILKKQSIQIRAGDRLLSNNKGSYLLLKRKQPGALRFKFLMANELYGNYFEGVDKLLFEDERHRYCFLDYTIMHSVFDCEKIAIKDFPPYQYVEATSILIDTVNNSIKVIR